MGLDEPACVLFTSGSTGRPKGIVNSQRNLLQRVAQSINAAHINADDRLLTLASPCTIVGVRDVMTALLAGASIHLLDPQGAGAREISEHDPGGGHHDPVRVSGSLAIGRHGQCRTRAGSLFGWFAWAATRRCGATSTCCARGSHRGRMSN